MIIKTLKTVITTVLALMILTNLLCVHTYAYENIIAFGEGSKKTIISNNSLNFKDISVSLPHIEGEFCFSIRNSHKDDGYNPNNYPKETYEGALDAYYAFSMIESVSQTVKSSETGFTVRFANQGKIKEEFIAEDVKIISTSDSTDSLFDSNASVLKRGDIVYFDRKLDGKIKSISLIMRPPSQDIITAPVNYGANFELLFSDNNYVGSFNQWNVLAYGNTPQTGKGVTQYAFGLSAFKLQNTLYLLNKSGNLSSALEIFMNKNASVYICDLNSRRGIEVGDISSIYSALSNKQFYDGGTVSFNEASYSYALVRLVNGIAVDIAYYIY